MRHIIRTLRVLVAAEAATSVLRYTAIGDDSHTDRSKS